MQIQKCSKGIIDVLFTSLSISLSLEDVYNTLAIILAILNIVWLGYRVTSSFITHYKEKNLNGMKNDVKEFQDGINSISNDIRDKMNNKDGGSDGKR
jgi:hypothetical protein